MENYSRNNQSYLTLDNTNYFRGDNSYNLNTKSDYNLLLKENKCSGGCRVCTKRCV